MPTLNVVNDEGTYFPNWVDQLPTECPQCHHGIEAKFIYGYRKNVALQIVFLCPREQCNRMFIAYYVNRPSMQESSLIFKLDKVAPLSPKYKDFGDDIRRVSPRFQDIYNQASAAETYELSAICGPGYGKALEFLIKDFLIATASDSETKEKIASSLLGVVINNYVNDPLLKDAAQRAAWLRNDETHYIRKFAELDITDLKALINLTVNWVQSNLTHKKYVESMNSRK